MNYYIIKMWGFYDIRRWYNICLPSAELKACSASQSDINYITCGCEEIIEGE